MRRTIVVLMLLLAGCDRWKPARPEVEAPTQAQTTATQASDFSKPILARGNEPFWSLKIDGTAFTLKPQSRFFATPACCSPPRGR